MDAARLSPPRRLTVPLSNRWGAGEMSVLDFGDPKRPVDLIFVHANGFNAATYRSLLAPLSSSLRILAPDLRGHGQTRLPLNMKNRWSWADHRDDLVQLMDSLTGPPVALAGHSMGGTSALLAAAERPQRVSRMVLFDPVILSALAIAAFKVPLFRGVTRRYPLVAGALRRRASFADRKQALDSYKGRGAFKGWPDMMLADYISDGFVDGEGEVTLACSPQWEASNYAAQSHDPRRALRQVGRPVRILKAERGSTCTLTTAPGRTRDITVETVAGGTHFFPMLKPEVARDALFDVAV